MSLCLQFKTSEIREHKKKNLPTAALLLPYWLIWWSNHES